MVFQILHGQAEQTCWKAWGVDWVSLLKWQIIREVLEPGDTCPGESLNSGMGTMHHMSVLAQERGHFLLS